MAGSSVVVDVEIPASAAGRTERETIGEKQYG
jgi:hypothetical protein